MGMLEGAGTAPHEETRMEHPTTVRDSARGPALGDAAAATLVEHHGRFLAFLERRVRSAADAEEILQAAYLKGVSAPEGPRDESVVAWFYRILRNALVDHYRRRDAERRALDRTAQQAEGDAAAEDDALRDAACACVLDVLPTLRSEHAAILQSVDVEERPIADVAAASGITAGNARVRLHRARAALRERVLGVCGACGDGGCSDCSCG